MIALTLTLCDTDLNVPLHAKVDTPFSGHGNLHYHAHIIKQQK